MIICNGVPKNGTNILQKLCALLNYKDSQLFLVQHKKNKSINARYIENNNKKKISYNYANNVDNNYFCHAHIANPIKENLSQHKILTIWRDPRDSAVSFIRWAENRNKPNYKNNKEDLKRLIKEGYGGSNNWIDLYYNYIEWLNYKNCCNISYESLKKGYYDNIKEYLEIDFDDEYIYKNLFGNYNYLPNNKKAYSSISSYSGNESNYKNYWNNDLENTWKKLGGNELINYINSYFLDKI